MFCVTVLIVQELRCALQQASPRGLHPSDQPCVHSTLKMSNVVCQCKTVTVLAMFADNSQLFKHLHSKPIMCGSCECELVPVLPEPAYNIHCKRVGGEMMGGMLKNEIQMVPHAC